MPRPDPFNDAAVIDWLEVEKAVEAFESARAGDSGVALRDFLPPPNDLLYERVLRELIRIELEDSWGHGVTRFIEAYRSDFPIIFQDREGLGELAFEEYRLRRLAGDSVAPSEYERRYGIETSDWPEWNRPREKHTSVRLPLSQNGPPPEQSPKNPSLEAAAQSYLRLRLGSDSVSVENLNSWLASCTAEPEKAEFFRDLHLSAPEKASLLAEGLTQLPEVGTEFLGFRLISELGRGAFGRVYLAKQGDLANRSVALKVAADVFDESQSLAQLQHTNIVPIYSIHRLGKLQAVCMPYFGLTTLADILSHVESRPSLPDSGKFVVSTLNNRKTPTRRIDVATLSSTAPSQSSSGEKTLQPAVPETSDSEGILHQLAGYSYVQAVLWMGSRLADGLAHAHSHGILHRDLKPANILLTDDGQPMLLDFNLSADLKGQAHRATVGGTLPYMAPEHLDAFRGRQRALDARSDIYALGVMMYELLAGKRPFPTYRGESDDMLGQLLDDRMKGAPSLRKHNPAVSPAMESIVRTCLAPKPENRYQTAGDLHEDLERHLKNLPLKHAPEPSLKERFHKWMRRHPRLASTTSVSLAAGFLIVALTTVLIIRNREMAHFKAAENFRLFQEPFSKSQFLLYSQKSDPAHLNEGDAAARNALARYGLPENTKWRELPAVRNLPHNDQELLQDQLGELLFLLGKATAAQATFDSTPKEKTSHFQTAMDLTMLAETAYGAEHSFRAVLEQRRALAKELGQAKELQEIETLLRSFTRETPKDDYLGAHQYAIKGNYRQALQLLQKTTQNEPTNFSAWFVRGNCYFELARDTDAIGCFNVCVALRPDFAECWQARAFAHLRNKNYRQAVEDYDQAIRLQPKLVDAYMNRALAHDNLGEFREALADLNAAIELDPKRSHAYLFRANVRRKTGDKAGAEHDEVRGLGEEPHDALSWVARALAKRESDPRMALADLEQALKLNPHSFEGLQNKAALLDDKFHKDKEALDVMNEAVRIYPDSVLARGGRGVLLARIDKRTEALEDAQEALLLDSSPPTLYQVACIYAQTSKKVPDDRVKALNLLSAALRTGFALEWIDTDHDLDPLRKLPEFAKAVAAARELAAGANGSRNR
ncbi:MAG TPA: tetratricopeptide repeat protein [Gemmataceae bacterium]|jgi:serine/threonine protein kinase/Flp pilus assembly protein TadD|nr:tetratricopeptide repeat protein [Gemmataceae bacterium]